MPEACLRVSSNKRQGAAVITIITMAAIRALMSPLGTYCFALTSTASTLMKRPPPSSSSSLIRQRFQYHSTTTSTALMTESLSQSQSQSLSKASREDLQKLTVKELKEKIKELDVPVKMSQLRLKADVIDFLIEQYDRDGDSYGDANASISASAASPDVSSTPRHPQKIEVKKKTKRLSMPPLRNQNFSTGTSTDNSIINPETKINSPKDAIFQKVYDRYPPLRDLKVASDNLILEKEHNAETGEESFADHLPPHFYKSYNGLGELDIRQQYHPVMADMTSSDMDLVTIGTASCVPGVTRGVSCTALRLQWRRNNSRDQRGGDSNKQQSSNNNNNQSKGRGKQQQQQQQQQTGEPITPGTWMFDCGESTQLQIQRTGAIRPGKISKIFITHAHGDHSFGLPGLLCIMGQDRDRNGPPVEIYGPEGIRQWLRTCVRYSISRIVPPYRVHELMDIPMAPEWAPDRRRNGRYHYQLNNKRHQPRPWGTQGLAGEDPVSWISRAPMINLEPSPQFGEVPGGRDIYPLYNHPKCVHGAPIWEIEDEGDVKVHAAPMSHGVPSVGYVVEEESKPGRLRNDLVAPIAQRNIRALKDSGMKHPMKVMQTIKELAPGESYTFPDGTVVRQEDVVEPPRKGRKVVICGDTADCRAISGLADGADILVHEATNAYLHGIDKDTNQKAVEKDAKLHGHSTPEMAGRFAKKIGAKRLVLNHFSSRYKGDQSVESMSIMTRIEEAAIKASELPTDKVVAGWDFMLLPIPQND